MSDTEFEAIYDYVNREGALLFQVCRKPGKDFVQRRPDPDNPGAWLWDLKGVKKVPYHLPELLDPARKNDGVYVVEGEKDVDRLRTEGLLATCNSGGAGKWDPSYSNYLRGRHVAIIPDNDRPGQGHAYMVANDLERAFVAKSVRIVLLPKKFKDVSDFLEKGGTIEELKKLVRETETFGPIQKLADIKSSTIDWRWRHWLPRGKAILIGGGKGVGKTHIAAEVVAALSTGKALPGDGNTKYDPARVLFITLEDDPSDVLKPMLEKARADLDLVSTFSKPLLDNTGRSEYLDLMNPAHLDYLKGHLTRSKFEYIVIDPIKNYLGALEGKGDIGIRQAMTPLLGLMQETGTTMLFIVHNRKGGGDAYEAVSGSYAWTQIARVVWQVSEIEDESDKKHRFIAPRGNHVPGNLGSLEFDIFDDNSDTGAFRWVGQSDLTADELVSPGARASKEARNELVAFLKDILRDGPVPSKTLFRLTAESGYSKNKVMKILHSVAAGDHDGFGPGSQYTWKLHAHLLSS